MNNQGFSLAELVMAAGVSILVMSIGTMSYIQGISVFNTTMRTFRAESEMLNIMMTVKATFAQATNISYGGAMTAGNNAFTTRGAANADVTEGRLFRRVFNTDVSGAPMLVAVGIRDMGVNDAQSQFYGFSAVFQPPTPTTSGVFYVDMERDDASTPGGFVRLSPVNAPLAFSGLVNFGVENVRVRAPDGSVRTALTGAEIGMPILSTEMFFRLRYYTSGVPSDWRWCPTAVTGNAACNTTAGFLEKQRNFKVVFANNNLDDPINDREALPGRSMGGIYFFRAFVPTMRQ